MVQIAIPYAYTVVPYANTRMVCTIRVRYEICVWYTTRPILIIFMHTLLTKSHYSGFCTLMRLNATYLVNEVSYAKTDFAILFSTEGAFSSFIIFLFRTFLSHKSAAVLWTSLIPSISFQKTYNGKYLG